MSNVAFKVHSFFVIFFFPIKTVNLFKQRISLMATMAAALYSIFVVATIVAGRFNVVGAIVDIVAGQFDVIARRFVVAVRHSYGSSISPITNVKIIQRSRNMSVFIVIGARNTI